MPLTRILCTSSVLALITSPAFADLTAEQVLADQLAQMSLYGLTVQTQGESRSGNALTVESLSASAELPEEGFSMNMTMAGATFTEQGDGSVLITYPNEIPIEIVTSIEDLEDDVTVSMSMTQTGLQALVTGSPEQIRYEATGQSVSIDNLAFTGPDETGEIDMSVDIDMSGLLAVFNIGAGTVRPYDLDMTIDNMKMVMAISEPSEEGVFDLTFDMNALKAVYGGTMAPQGIMDSFAQVIAAGNVTAGSFDFGAMNYTAKINSPDGGLDMAATMGSGQVAFSMDENGIDYGGTSSDITTTVGGSMIPFPPMTFSMAEYEQRFKMPVVPSEDGQDVALKIGLIDLVVDPIVWGMIDPTEQLPRDPATLVIDMSGEVVMLEDVFAPDFAETGMVNGPPGQINALDINAVQLSIAGTELTGDGALTFNNDGMIPMPVGVVNLMLTGGNTLLDTLVGMGLIPQEQAMGARMMTGMFARPGDGPDTLVSTIEMNEDGSILANGQRIK